MSTRRLPSLRALEAFIRTVRLGSAKAAAHELGLSPSALSRRVSALEEFTGKRLFTRQHQAMKLTDDGQAFYDAVEPRLEELALAVESQVESDAVLRLHLGVPSLFGEQRLFPRLLELRQLHPRLHIDIETGRNLGERVGDTLDVSQSGEVTVTASVIGRGNFETLEIIQNGQVVASESSKSVNGHFVATLRKPINVTEPGWLAARITTANKNEYGRALFGHTSAVYVTLQGRSIRRAADVAWLRHEVETARATIADKAQFDTAEQRQKVLGLYDQSLKILAE